MMSTAVDTGKTHISSLSRIKIRSKGQTKFCIAACQLRTIRLYRYDHSLGVIYAIGKLSVYAKFFDLLVALTST